MKKVFKEFCWVVVTGICCYQSLTVAKRPTYLLLAPLLIAFRAGNRTLIDFPARPVVVMRAARGTFGPSLGVVRGAARFAAGNLFQGIESLEQ